MTRRKRPTGARSVTGKRNRRAAPGPGEAKPRRWETSLIATLCVVAAVRVCLFSATFPFFNNIDEQNHVDLVLKYARGYWPREPVERIDFATGRLLALYATFEYLSPPERFRGGVFPRPLWERPAGADRVWEGAALWAQRINDEAHSPPVYYAVAGAWYRLGGWLGLSGGRQLYWVRFLNVPLCAMLVSCAYLFCRDGYSDRPELRLGVPILVAFLPQDIFYSISSDVLSPFLFAASLCVLLAWYRSEERRVGKECRL